MNLDLEELRILHKLPLRAIFTRDDGDEVVLRVEWKRCGVYAVEELKKEKPRFKQAFATARQAQRFLYLRERQLVHNHFKCTKVTKEKML